jgi:hypothetical protein
MNLPAHLRRSRHGIYYFRIVLPKALAKTVGRREVIRSLGTHSRQDHPLGSSAFTRLVTPPMEIDSARPTLSAKARSHIRTVTEPPFVAAGRLTKARHLMPMRPSGSTPRMTHQHSSSHG